MGASERFFEVLGVQRRRQQEFSLSDSFMTPSAFELNPGEEAPVSEWLRQLEVGESSASEALYQHFCARLHEFARQRLPARVRRGYDEEDVAVSAFNSLFLGVRGQRLSLRARTDFWRLLLKIAERKIAHRIRYELRDKRDLRRLVEDSVFAAEPVRGCRQTSNGSAGLESREPTPEFAAEVAETCDTMLAALPDDVSRKTALLKLENHTDEEIAGKLGCTRRTVQRKLVVIRRTWQVIGGFDPDAENMSQSGKERS